MPGAPTSIVIGGGINAGSPFVLDNFLFVASATPPTAASSPRLIRRADSIEILGDGANSTAIGSNADANGPESIAIGRDCSVASVAATSDVICIGQNMKNTGNVGEAILIGHDVNSNGTSIVVIGTFTGITVNANSFVAIGHSMTQSGTLNGVIIGFGAGTSGGNAIAIGGSGATAATGGVTLGCAATQASTNSNTITIGQGAISNGATATSNLIIGSSAGVASAASVANLVMIGHNLRTDNGTYVSGDVVIGNNNVGGGGFSSSVIWFGDTHTSGVAVPAAAMRWKNAAGTNVAAGALTITAPRATGNASNGAIIFRTGTVGASGSTLATALARVTIGNNGQTTFETPTGAIATVNIMAAGGAGVPCLNVQNATDGAGAAAGTLANAPTAGDPAFWLPISIGGAVRYIPCWP